MEAVEGIVARETQPDSAPQQRKKGDRDTERSTETSTEPPAPTDGWPMFRANAANTGHAPDGTGPIDNVVQKWVFEVGYMKTNVSPAVVNGTVYVGSVDNRVYALDAATGRQHWAFKTGDWVGSSPAVVDGTVYVGSSDGKLYALTE